MMEATEEAVSDATSSLVGEKIQINEEPTKPPASDDAPSLATENIEISKEPIKPAASNDAPLLMADKIEISDDATEQATSDDIPSLVADKNITSKETTQKVTLEDIPALMAEKTRVNKAQAPEQATSDDVPSLVAEKIVINKVEGSHAAGKQQQIGNTTRTCTETEPKAESERILFIFRLHSILTEKNVEEFIVKYTNQEIRSGLERVKIKLVLPNHTTAWLVFKTTELAQQAKMLLDTSDLRYEYSMVCNFDLASGNRLYPDGTLVKPIVFKDSYGNKSKIYVCHICLSPNHAKIDCPILIKHKAKKLKHKTDEVQSKTYNVLNRRFLKFAKLPRLYTNEEFKLLIGNLTNQEIENDIEDVCVFKTHKLSIIIAHVLMKTPELAQKVKSLLEICKESNKIHFEKLKLCYYHVERSIKPKCNDDGSTVSTRICYSCGQQNHIAKDCPQNLERESDHRGTTRMIKTNKKCYTCGQWNHIAEDCPLTLEGQNESTKSGRIRTKRPAFDDTDAPVSSKIRKLDRGYCKTLILTNVAPIADRKDIREFLKIHIEYINPEAYQAIKYIYMAEKLCYVRFSSARLCSAAKIIINNLDSGLLGKKIRASYDIGENRVLWLPNNKPNINKMMARSNREDLNMTSSSKEYEDYPEVENPSSKSWQQNFNSGSERSFNEVNWASTPTQGRDDNNSSKFKNDMFLNYEVKEYDTFGLKESFLQAIGVTPPLDSKIFVDGLVNLYDDENRIRNLFSHAGSVSSVAVIERYDNLLKLKVEFEHPVEAVQAISMFHDQEIYGKKLKVIMAKTFNTSIFPPPGLKAFGPGLGQNGTPIKNVKSTIELQKAVNIIMKEMNTQKYENGNSSVRAGSQTPQLSTSQPQITSSTPATNNDAQNLLASLASSLTNPAPNNPLLALSALLNPQTTQALQLLTQQNASNNLQNTSQTQVNTQPQMVPQPIVYQQPQMIPEQHTSSDFNTMGNTLQSVIAQNIPSYNTLASTNMQYQNMQGLMYGDNSMYYQGYVQGGTNMQPILYPQAVVPNMHSQNMQVANMQDTGSNMQATPNMQTSTNIPSGFNTSTGDLNMPVVSHLKGHNAININKHDKCTVLFSYLPPSVTNAALLSKMSEVGEVLSAALAGPGRAIVTFRLPKDAKTCIDVLHKTKVDGQVIHVKYL